MFNYLFKALWIGTAHRFWIEAKDDKQALKRAERYVWKMEGARTCLDLVLEKKIRLY